MKEIPYSTFNELAEKVIHCRRCPRLVCFRETVPPKAAFKHQTYWRKPLPGWGDPNAALLILGLAPAADGGNRTGRILTGDPTATFLMKALYNKGFASCPNSISKDDGLELKNCYLTASVKCVPPKNLPLAEEFRNCRPYFENEIDLLKQLKAILALGKGAFDTYLSFLSKKEALPCLKPTFFHGAFYQIGMGFPALFTSYHPSPQNTYTGKLTEDMFLSVLNKILTFIS